MMSDSDIDQTNVSKCDEKHNSTTSLAPTIHDFDILKPISRGAFGKVFLCNRKDAPEKKLAVKVMKKSELVQKNMVDQVIAERNALAITKSPFVVGLLYCLQTVNNVFLVMEYMIGGDLKSLLSVYGYLEEEHAVFYFAECVLALKYLHSRGIVHRDIKPDNMLISQTGHLKLTDFGLSSTGMKDKELHVADLVAKTPFPAGSKAHKERLIRTPGQILSLTSHLSFSNVTGDTCGSGNESLGGSYTAKDTTSHTCDVSEYGRQSRAGHSTMHVSSNVSVSDQLNASDIKMSSMSFCGTRPTSSASLITTPNEKQNVVMTSSTCEMVTPVQSSKVRLVRKNSFSEAMAKHVKETTKDQDLSRMVLDKKTVLGHNSTSPEHKLNSSALQSLPNSSFDFGPNKTIEFAQNISNDNDNHDEVFEEDKENLCLPSSPLKFIPSSPLHSLISPPPPSETPSPTSPSFQLYSLPNLQNFNDDSRGSISSSPKNNKVKNFDEPLNISPLKPILTENDSLDTSDNTTPVLTPTSRVMDEDTLAAENMRCLRDVETTLSPELLRCDQFHHSFDSDIHLERPEQLSLRSPNPDNTQEMDISAVTEHVDSPDEDDETRIDNLRKPSEEDILSRTSTPSPLPVPNLLSPESDKVRSPIIRTPEMSSSSFKIPDQSSSMSLKRKCSSSPSQDQESIKTHLTSDLTNLVISSKKVRLDTDVEMVTSINGEKPSLSSTSSSSSEEEGRQGYGFSTPVHQYSTPLSAVPQHMKQFKGMKAVKFVSPAGLTPVQHPEANKLQQQPLKMPFSLAELDTSRPPATPPHFAPSPSHVFKTPSHPSPSRTPLRTPKSMSRPRRQPEPSRILGTPDYLAPELLLGQGHGKEVDWWALGACLYEFMTGIPPFNDDTPEMVFDNILSLNIEWPEGEEALSQASVDCIMSLLCLDPQRRADDEVIQNKTELTRHVMWNELLDQTPAFVPQPDSNTDTTYFNAKNSIQGLKVSCVDI